ncbi:uncharacterized protein LOC144025795 isoform X2 [Festucalex cinctus]
MTSNVAKVKQTLSELTSDDFQKLCKQLVSRGSLKEGKYSTAEELLTVLTSSLGKEESYNVIDASLEEIGYLAEEQSTDDSGQRELQQLKSVFISRVSPLVLYQLLEYLDKADVLSARERRIFLNPYDLRREAAFLIDVVLDKSIDELRSLSIILHKSYPSFIEVLDMRTGGSSNIGIDISGQMELDKLRESEIIAPMSFSLFYQLLEALYEAHVLSDDERLAFLNASTETRRKAQSLIDRVLCKGPKASREMLFYLKERDPDLFQVFAGTRGTRGRRRNRGTRRRYDTGGSRISEGTSDIKFPIAFRHVFISQLSFSHLYQLLEKLDQANVLNDSERLIFLDPSMRRQNAESLIDCVLEKGPEASRKMLFFLSERDPTFLKFSVDAGQAELIELKPEFISRVCFSVLYQLLEDLYEADVLTAEERKIFLNPCDRIKKAESLIDLVINKGQRASHMMWVFLRERDINPFTGREADTSGTSSLSASAKYQSMLATSEGYPNIKSGQSARTETTCERTYFFIKSSVS